jgi:hypothetical protein
LECWGKTNNGYGWGMRPYACGAPTLPKALRVTALSLLTALVCTAQTSVPPAQLLSPRSLMPAAPIWSSDRLICVRSSLAMAGYRAPVLMFTDNARAEFFRATRVTFIDPPVPITIFIGNKRDGDTRVLSSRLRLSDNEVIERIELPDPEAADLTLFRRTIWMALYRSWLVASSGGEESTLSKLPIWLAEGAIRKMDKATWAADMDRILALWSHASLPPAKKLLLAKNGASAEPALGTVLIAYLTERKTAEGKSILDVLIQQAAAGNDWSPDRIATAITGAPDLHRLDEDMDLWLLSLSKKVVFPGLTSEGILERFRSTLLIYPSDYGKFFDYRKPCITFHELIQVENDKVMKQAALGQAKWIRMATLGRDTRLGEVAEHYVAFLEAYAAGKKSEELTNLLSVAEAQRKELEQLVRDGKTLKSE